MQNQGIKPVRGYELAEQIGAGGQGEVYRALQVGVGREVALKLIRGEIAGQPRFIHQFELRLQQLARMEHLHITPLFDFWREPDGAYIVMRWYAAGSLKDALDKGAFSLTAAARLLDQAAAGLDFAHRSRLVHGNLKPGNILLDAEGNAYLSDFAIIESGQTGSENREALSPEQARGHSATTESDIYALGVILYEMLTGMHPYPEGSAIDRLYRHLEEPLPSIQNIDKAVRMDVNDVLARATAKDPTRRFSTAGELAEVFRNAAGLLENSSVLDIEESLTRREQEILAHIARGDSNKAIASALFVELGTVKWHITQLYRKLGVRSRMQAIARAQELNLFAAELVEGGVRRKNAVLRAGGPLLNPYKGLRPFGTADSGDFFGREAVVDRLLEHMAETGQFGRFLAVVGPSGSGKSSLLAAGLLPALRQGRLPGAENWFTIRMVPGANPIDELEIALTRIAANQSANLHAHLHRDDGGLHRAANLILPGDGSELLLFIDQFEEVFTLTEKEAVRNQFLSLLSQAVADPHSRVRVLIGLRADFYDRPLYHPAFGELVRQRTETLLPLSAGELERAIEEPARRAGAEFEASLPADIIESMLYQPGALPLLQYALTELFEGREDRLLTREAYGRLGGAVGAIARRADEVYREFGEDGQEAARQMFLRLVNIGDTGKDGGQAPDTRRRVPRAELLALATDAEVMDEVIDTYGAYRMLALDHDTASRQPIVELAHEALISEWPRLRQWLADNRDDLVQHHRFREMAAEWAGGGRDVGFLLRSSRLDQFLDWAAATSISLDPEERAFLDASVAARENRQEAEDTRRQRELTIVQQLAETETLRAEEQSRANRRLRWLAAWLALLLVAAVGAALFARSESRRALEQAKVALSRELAAEVLNELDTDPELAIALALESVRTTQDTIGYVLPVAEAALHSALQASRVRLRIEQCGGIAFSPDGKLLVIGGMDGSVEVRDANTGALVRAFKAHNTPVLGMAISPDGKLLASAGTDYERIVWKMDSYEPVFRLPPSTSPDRGLIRVAFSPDSRLLVSSFQYDLAGIWDVSTGEQLAIFEDSAGPAAAFKPNGDQVALMSAVWDLAAAGGPGFSGEAGPIRYGWADRLFDFADPLTEFIAPSSAYTGAFLLPGSVSYSPDGQRLLTSLVSIQAVMRDSLTGKPLFTLSGHSNIINHSAFSPDGRIVATGSADGTARVWDAETGEELLVIGGHSGEIIQVAFSPGGRQLATSSLDGTTRLWDVGFLGGGEWTIPGAGQDEALVVFNPLAPILVAVTAGGEIRAFDLERGETLFDRTDAYGDLPDPAFSADGSTLVIATADRNLVLLDSSTGEAFSGWTVERWPQALALSPDGSLIAAGTQSGQLVLIRVEAGGILGQWDLFDGFVNQLVFTSDGGRLIAAGANGIVTSLTIEELLRTNSIEDAIQLSKPAHGDVIAGLDITPDGSRWLTASWDGTAVVWNGETGITLYTLSGHQGRVWDAAFDPSGSRVVTAGADGRLLVWDAASGSLLFELDTATAGFFRLAFSGDGRFLAATTSDGQLRVYLMKVDDLAALAQIRLTRAMTDAECREYLHDMNCP